MNESPSFDREQERKILIQLRPELTSKEIDDILDDRANRRINLVNGDKVIHLAFSGSLVPEEEELPRFRSLIEAEGFKFSYYDKDFEIQASTEHANFLAFDSSLLNDIATAALYDTIKELLVFVWDKARKGFSKRVEADGTVHRHPAVTTINITVGT